MLRLRKRREMNMYNPRFEKEAFKKEVTNNVKTLFRRTVDEANSPQLCSRRFPMR